MENPRCLEIFLESCKSQVTRRGYLFQLNKFLTWAKKDYESVLFLEKTELTDLLVDYTLYLKKRVLSNSIPGYLAGTFKFLEMNDREFNKRKIRQLYGEKRKRAGGRPITNNEINEIIRVVDSEKNHALIQVLASTGCRPEGLSELKMKHIESIGQGCLSLLIYAGSTHEHHVFLHKVASDSLRRYHKSRELKGEKLESETPVFSAERRLASLPVKAIHSTTISGIVSDLMSKARIKRVKVNSKNYDLASCGSFRKRFNTILKSNAEIPYAVAEKLMDHSNYLEKHYFKTSREDMFSHFVKAIPELIFEESERQKVEIAELHAEKSELEQKNNELEMMKDEIRKIKQKVDIQEKFNKVD
jgi:integrase